MKKTRCRTWGIRNYIEWQRQSCQEVLSNLINASSGNCDYLFTKLYPSRILATCRKFEIFFSLNLNLPAPLDLTAAIVGLDDDRLNIHVFLICSETLAHIIYQVLNNCVKTRKFFLIFLIVLSAYIHSQSHISASLRRKRWSVVSAASLVCIEDLENCLKKAISQRKISLELYFMARRQ